VQDVQHVCQFATEVQLLQLCVHKAADCCCGSGQAVLQLQQPNLQLALQTTGLGAYVAGEGVHLCLQDCKLLLQVQLVHAVGHGRLQLCKDTLQGSHLGSQLVVQVLRAWECHC
jgi:hypothetical protein